MINLISWLGGVPVVLAGLLWSGAVFAGSPYVDGTGYAVSGYDVVAYHSLPQGSIDRTPSPAVPGKVAFTAEWNGAKWAFASAANRDRFLADPAKFAPRYDGHCAYGVAQGYKVPANPHAWRVVDDALYLNYNLSVAERWRRDIPGYRRDAEANWPGLDPTPPSGGAVSGLDTASAPIQ